METYQDEREIDLKQLFLTVMAKWRVLLLCALIGALLGAAYQSVKSVGAGAKGSTASDSASTATTEEEIPYEYADYLRDKANYDALKNYYVSRNTEDIAVLNEQSNYLAESIYAQLDPNKVIFSRAIIYVKTKESETRGVSMTQDGNVIFDEIPTDWFRILLAYQEMLVDSTDFSSIARRFDTEERYLKELMSCSRDVLSGRLYIQAFGYDEKLTEAIVDALVEQAHTLRPQIEKIAGAHTLEVLRIEPYEGLYRGLYNTQYDDHNRMQNVRNRLAANQDALAKLTEPQEPAGYSVTSAESAEATTGGTAEELLIVEKSAGINPASLVKFAILGLFGGFFLSAFAYAVWYVLSGRVLSADELNRRYRIKALSVLPADNKQGLDATLASFGNDRAYLNMTKEERIQVAASNFSVYAPDVKDVLLVGSVAADTLESVATLLREKIADVRFTCASHINENAASLEALKTQEHVVLVEQALKSSYGEVDREMQQLADWGKTVIGSVVIY